MTETDEITQISCPKSVAVAAVNSGLVVILACVNQNSIWDTCNDTDGTPCDDTTLTWLHTLDHDWLEVVANLLLGRLAAFGDTDT